jgi:hypothetical protein
MLGADGYDGMITPDRWLVAYEDTWRGPAGHIHQAELESKIGQIEAWCQCHHLEVWRDWSRVAPSTGKPGRGVPVMAGGWKDGEKLKGMTDPQILAHIKQTKGLEFATIHECCAYLMSRWVERRVMWQIRLTEAKRRA